MASEKTPPDDAAVRAKALLDRLAAIAHEELPQGYVLTIDVKVSGSDWSGWWSGWSTIIWPPVELIDPPV